MAVRRLARYATLALCLAAAAAPREAAAEQPPVRAYTTADGLASDGVTGVLADSRGFLWFATTEGVSRFDGYQFANYTTYDGLPDRRVNDLCETGDGTLWVATASGLCRFEARGRTGAPLFAIVPLGDDRKANAVNALLATSDGALWCGTDDGLYRLDPGAERWAASRVDLGADIRVEALAEDRWGGVWAATLGAARLVRPDGGIETYALAGAMLGQLHALYVDDDGTLWVGTRAGTGRSAPRPTPDAPVVLSEIERPPPRWALNWGNAFLRSRDGTLWIATSSGLWRERGETVERVQALDGTCDRGVTGLAEDRDGNLWLATGCGVLHVNRYGFTGYTAADGLVSSAVCSVFESNSGDLIVTTRRVESVVHRLDGAAFTSVVPNLPRLGYYGWGWGQMEMQDREGAWWVPTQTGLYRYPRAERPEDALRAKPEAIYTKEDLEVFRLFEDSRGDVWFSTIFGLLRWERATGRVADLTAETGVGAGVEYTAFAEARDGAVWVGTNGAGLLRYRDAGFTRLAVEDGAPAGWVRALYRDDAGRLWVASSRGGIARVDDPTAERPAFAAYTMAEGLSSDNVWCVVADASGRVYAGTPRGLDRIDLATGRVRRYTSLDGLPSGQPQAAFRDRNGSLWFGTPFGLVRLDPEPEREREPPRTLVTGLRTGGVALPVSALGEVALPAFEVGPEASSVGVEFLGLGARLGEELRYQYRLEGAEDDWSAPSAERAVTFASLAPGSYRFLVRAVDADGLASPEPASVQFVVLAPVWRRPWFLALAAALVGLAAYGLHRYRVGRLLEVERVRTHIATDLHDDIGANLTRIAFLSEAVGMASGGAAAGDGGALGSIARISRESVASMNDIVWAIDPNRDTLADMAQRMRSYAEEVFLVRGVELDFSAPEDAALRLRHDLRRQLYLAFKECVNNAARHSECAHVSVELRAEGRRLVLEVSDDGRGFDASSPRRGNGLANLRKRAAALGADLEVESEPGRGTRIALAVPLRPPARIRRWRARLGRG